MNDKTQLKRASKLGVIFYSCGDLASQFVWTFIGSYLTIFYTDIVGLAPAAAAAIMMIARVWDAVNDPMMGASDLTYCLVPHCLLFSQYYVLHIHLRDLPQQALFMQR